MNQLKVQDIMTRSPLIMGPEKSAQDAAMIMKEYDCGALLVGNEEMPLGIITDRDITLRVIAMRRDPATTQLKALMSAPLHCCSADATLEQAAEQMRTFGVRRLVVARDGRACGVITLGALLKQAGTQKLSDEVLHTLLGTRRKQREMVVSSIAFDNDVEDFGNFEGVF